MVLQSVAAGLLVILVVELTLPGSCSGWLVSSRRTKCYEQPPIGCFPTTYPYNNTGRRAPQRPSVVNVQFFFFNSGVSSTMFNYDNADQVLANTYNSSAKTVVIIHGYLENSDRPWIRQLGTELLQKDSHMNVVVVSWVGGSRNLIYFQSAANARVAGAVIALLLEKLVVLGGDKSKFHVIGFSLGAHVAGYVGSRLRGIGRITGLDPARLGFERTPPEARLDPTDAIFVDVIHTDASPIVGLGTFQSLGTVDFYPNGGVNQPGCSVDIINTVSAMMSSFDFSMDSVRAAVACSHLRVTSLFTASVNHNCSYTTLRCSNNFPRGSCRPCESGACPIMGYNIDSTRGIQTAGLYRTVTTSTSPYCSDNQKLHSLRSWKPFSNEDHIFGLLGAFAVASAVPASVKKWDSYTNDGSSDSCASTCNGQPNKFSYKSGTTYIYDYTVNTDTSMFGASEESAKLSFQVRAEIQAIDGCDFALLLKNVRVSHTDAYTGQIRASDREDEFQRVLEGSNLRFSFDDGVISSVCPERSESTWALNFKRGLLTAFQNSMESMDKDHQVSEVDVSGECLADFVVTSTWGWKKDVMVTKTKNLLTCSKRDGIKSMFQAIPYSVSSDIHSMPVLKGTHKCDYIISSNKILQSVVCEENHLYVPFSNQENGGKTRVQQKLTLMSQKDGVDAVIGPVKERLTLLFQHEDVQQQVQNGPESLEQKLKEICDQTHDDIRPQTPRLYSELVQIIKGLNKLELEQEYKLVKDKIICPKNVRTMKFFMDALPMAGTEGAVSLLTTLINTKQVDGILAISWLTSLTLIQKPTSSIVEDGLKLLQGPLSSDALLPVSAVVNKYCQTVSSCESDHVVRQVVNVLRSKVPKSCSVDEKNLKDVLLTLRAIGNIGQSLLTSTLDTCISSSTTPLEVKVAAADAYRRMPCDNSFSQKDSAVWTVLQDPSQDSELRITSYLSVMRCPDDNTLSEISQLLDKETDDDLGGFIYSHIKNLKDTSDPLKQDIVKAINKYTFKEFELNLLKYSSNHEASVLINRLNLGFTADSNIIMGSKSPLPRSAMLNLTVDLFGNSVNLLEIGGRVEGLEILVEKLLGPTGYLPVKIEKGKLDDVKASVYARVFGNELFYEHLKGTQSLHGPAKMPNLLDILISIANRQAVAYTYSEQLLDVALTVPTIAGLPLEITVNGSVNLDLKAEGKADLRRVATSPRSMEIDGEFRPSAALEITGTMTVSAMSTKMGLRMRNTMHSSTWLKGHIKIDRGHVLSIEIDPPGDKMEIFNARSQFFIIHDEIEKEQNMITDNYQQYKLCSGDKLATIIGVELCGEIKFPNASSHMDSPYFPLTGPTSLSIMTFRRDTHTSYKVLATRKESKDSSSAQFLMDTPNSKVNRMISTDVFIRYTPDKQIDVLLVSPCKKFNLNSALVTNKDILSFVGSISVDDRDKYGLTTEVKISKTGNIYAYTPFIELTQGGRTETLLSGLVNVDFPNKLDANLEVKGFGVLPYTVKGDLINQNQEKRVELSVNRQGKSMYVFNVGSNFDINGKDNKNVKIEPTLIVKMQDETLISITGLSDYKSDRSAIGDLTVDLYQMKPASITWKIGQNSKSKISTYNVDLRFKSSILTGDIDGDISHQKNFFTSKLKITYNVPKFGTDIMTWNTKINNKSKNTFKKYIITSNLDMKKYVDYNTDLIVRLDHKKRQTDVEVEAKYGANLSNKKKTVTLKTSLNTDTLNWKESDVGFQLMTQVPEKNVDINMKMSHSHSSSKLDSNVNLKFSPYLKNAVDVGINLQDKSNNLMNYAGQANLGIMGKKFVVSSDMTQKSTKHFQHSLDVQDWGGNSHSINTVYKLAGSNGHEITSAINVNGYEPVQLQGKTVLNPVNFQASGSALYGKDLYNISARSEITEPVKKLSFDFVCPNRQVEADAEVKTLQDKVTGSVTIDWDAKSNSKSKISVDGSYRNIAEWDSRNLRGTLNVKTPFTNLEDVSAVASYNMDASQCSTKGTVSWGGKQETVSTSLVVKHPLSLQNVDVLFMATTPIRSYREIELEINHKLESTIASSVKGRLENNKAELLVKGENRGDGYNWDFNGLIEVKTPSIVLRDASFSLEHKDNGKIFETVGTFGHNGKKFSADLQMDHLFSRGNAVNNGKFKLSWPEDQLLTTWKHSNQGTKQISCSLESKWSGNKRVVVTLSGSNNVNSDLRHILSTVSVQTPWKDNRDIAIKFESKLGTDRLESAASLLNNRIEKIVYSILLERQDTAGTVVFMVKSPLYDQKIHGQSDINWNSYPLTASAWLEWAPWARVDFDGSLNAPSVDDIDLNTKLTTPFRNFENIIAKASHKLDNSEYVSHAALSYGVGKKIDFENRLRYDDIILFRTKLTSPCPYLKSLNTGLQLNASPVKFDGSADFELQPYVKKYDGFMTWNYDPSNWNSKIRLNTPHNQLPYVQITSWSKMSDGSLRTSHIDIDPSSFGVYSLDTSYKTELPYQLDVNIKTPHRQYDSVGLTAMHNPSDNALQSRLRVMYQRNKEIDSQLKLDWDTNFEGSFLVNTPYREYEVNKIFARHDISNRGFISRGEVNVGGQNVKGDVTYTSSPSGTSGSASLVSPLSGYEKLSGNFNVKGSLNKLVGDASLNIGSDTMSTTFTNNLNPGLLKSSVTLRTTFSEDVKLSIQHKDTSRLSEINIESSFNGQYGEQAVDGKVGVSYAGLPKVKVGVSFNSPIKSVQISLENAMTPDSITGKGLIQIDVESIGNIEVNYKKNGLLENMVATVSLTRNGDSMVDTLLETSKQSDNIHGKVVVQGKWLPSYSAQTDYKGIFSDFSTKTVISNSEGNIFDNDVTFKIEDSQVDLIDNLSYKYDSVDHRHVISVHKEGTLSNFKVDLSRKYNNEEVTAVISFQGENQIKGNVQIDNLSSKYDKVGVEFEHSGDFEKFLTTGKVILSSTEEVSGKVNFYRYNLQRIEALAELTTPWTEYKYNRIEYRHEGGDNRLSCSLNLKYGNGKKFSSDLITNYASSANTLSFNLKTPFKGYEEIILAGDFDYVTINGKAVLGKGMEFTVYGVYDPAAYPYHIQYQITTPLAVLKKVTLNVKGKPLDGTVDVVVVSLNKKIEGNGALQYSNPYKLSFSTQLSSDIQGYKLLQLNIRNEDDAVKGKTSHLLVSWDPTQQVVVDGRYFTGNSRFSSKDQRTFELDIKLPLEYMKNIAVDIEHNTETNIMQTLVSLEVDKNKLIDLDVNFDTSIKYEYSAVIRKPMPMEYTASYKYDDYMREGDVYISWNRDDPSSNVRVKSYVKNRPSDNDKSVMLTVITQSRTVGVEHNLASSSDKFSSSGKLYWDQGDDSKLSYSLDVSNSNRRRDTTYNGDLKLGFPTRTIGLTGSLNNNDLVRSADAVFSWDLDRDSSKLFKVQATVSGQEFTKADITFKLPANLQVTSALIFNQGNTILDGKTDISYTNEARKTLTLFSKLKNTPTSYGFFSDSGNSFNYSVELGLIHPDTKVDVKIDSHVARSDEILTSSLGIQYMTINRQMKNLALFAEIDKLKRQISLVTSGPSYTAGVSGAIASNEPLSLVLSGSLNGQEKFKSTLDVNKGSKTLNFEIGQPDNLLSLKAYYPNSSAFQTELFHNSGSDKQEAVIRLRLLNPHLLHSSIHWRPDAVTELGNFVTEQISTASQSTQRSLRQMNVDLRTELTGKYEEVTASIVEDLKPLVQYIGNEFESFATDLDQVKIALSDMHKNNEFFLLDIGAAVSDNVDYVSDAYISIQNELQLVTGMYRDTYKNLIENILQKLEDIEEYSFSDAYNQVVAQGIQDLVYLLDTTISNLITRLRQTDLKIMENAEIVLMNAQDLYNHEQLDFIRKRIEQLRDLDYYYYLSGLKEAMKNSVNLESYTNALYFMRNAAINRVIPEGVKDVAERTSNEIYQQAQLAYKHWDIEENFNKHLNMSVELLKEIVEYELKEYFNLFMIKNPFTVFDPKNGHIEADFILPVEVRYLDEMPNLTPYIQQVSNMYNKYTPDVDSIYQYSPSGWSSNKSEDDVLADFEKFTPSKSLRTSKDNIVKPKDESSYSWPVAYFI